MKSGERYIIQPDITSSSEYQIFDVMSQTVIVRGLSGEEARESKSNQNNNWEKERIERGIF